MATLTYTKTWIDDEEIDAADVNSNFDDIKDFLEGALLDRDNLGTDWVYSSITGHEPSSWAGIGVFGAVVWTTLYRIDMHDFMGAGVLTNMSISCTSIAGSVGDVMQFAILVDDVTVELLSDTYEASFAAGYYENKACSAPFGAGSKVELVVYGGATGYLLEDFQFVVTYKTQLRATNGS